MLKKLLTAFGILLVSHACLLAQQGTLKGTIKDAKTGEPLPFVNVIVEQNGQRKGGGTSDMDGVYTIKPLSPGSYEVKATFVGYAPIMKVDVNVKASGFTVEDLELTSTSIDITEVEIVDSKVKMIDIGDPAQGTTLSGKDIERMPATSVDGIAAITAGISYEDGGKGSARGEYDMVTMVGNVRKRGTVNIPKKSIAELQFILGGTPAKFGEARGGVQIITLNPPSPIFTGQVTYETSELFDTRGYNKGELYLTGPIWTKSKYDSITNVTDKKTIIGYRLSGYDSYRRNGMYRPHDQALWVLNDDVRKDLEQNPLYINPFNNAETRPKSYYFSKDDFSRQINTKNVSSNFVYAEGGLDFRFTDNMVLALNAEYTWSKATSGSLSNVVANNANNPESKGQSLSVNADFTHRFPTKDNTAVFQNLMYNITASYSRDWSESKSTRYDDNVFNYGYVGKFTTTKVPTYAMTRDQVNGIETYVWKQNGFMDTGIEFDRANTQNPFLANYTSQIYKDARIYPYLINYDNIRTYGGMLNGSNAGASGAYGLFNLPGTISNTYSKGQQDALYFQAKASVDIKNHAIEFGLQYDQLTTRSYSLAPTGLWILMRQLTNSHILELDVLNPIIDNSGAYPIVSYDRKNDQGSQTYFDRSVRNKLGAGATEWIDIDNLDPSFFNMNMFSADNLFNSGSPYVSYGGYDYTGKIVTGKHSLDDFFNNQSRTLDAFSPTYMAGYIQDQFYIKDLIFNVGIRLDRFDANQMVLKDPYLLYESKTVSEVDGAINTENGGVHPSSAKGDWVVYVDQFSDPSRSVIKGYRSGDVWYDAKGVEISDPNQIRGNNSRPTPFRKDSDITHTQVSSSAFKDYEAQYVFMPRIAFSFPVSDQSQFKASYDIIANRPSSAWAANYYSYMFMDKLTGPIANPNLKPEKVTNYEVGFEQVLTKSSALKINAYYKEVRDLIQLVQYTGADPNPSYYSYDNIDFKTTKGFTIQYDLRQTKNFRLIANYTLQYAEGTSLPRSTMESLIKAGYASLKVLNPIDDDIRNAFKLNLDYRFGMGKRYEGPKTNRKVKDKDGKEVQKTIKWLEGFGANFQVVAQSGKPYTRRLSNIQNTIVGSYNGSRLPWQFFATLVIDKTFPITVAKRETALTLQLRFNNLFNIRNIKQVYPVTGDPADNGYLTDPDTQSIIQAYEDPEAFRTMYQMYLDNSSYSNYTTPRSIILSIMYSF